jgi:hypothetical protein
MRKQNSYNYKLLTPHQNWIIKWVLIFVLIILMYGIYGTLTTNKNNKDIYYVDETEYVADTQVRSFDRQFLMPICKLDINTAYC